MTSNELFALLEKLEKPTCAEYQNYLYYKYHDMEKDNEFKSQRLNWIFPNIL
jgi:hypothetical protein